MYDPDTGFYELEKDKPLILLLSGIAREGVLSRLHTSARQYKSKLLESQAENWHTILEFFKDYTIECVLAKLSAHTISLMASPEYSAISDSLFMKIGSVPNVVFIYEDLLSGQAKAGDWSGNYIRPSEESRKLALALLEKHNVHVMPYRRNAEITIMAETFLSETEQHLVFRLYVPSGRIWSNESDKLLQLFREYLAKVANIEVRLDQYRTEKGVIYEIYSLSSNSKCNTAGPDGVRCCHAKTMLHASEYRGT